MSNESEHDNPASPKGARIGDLILLLKAEKQFLTKTNAAADSTKKLQAFIHILTKYRKLTLEQVDVALALAISKYIEPKYPQLDIRAFTFDDLKDKLKRSQLSREQLAIVAQKELGISKSKLLRLGRSAMENEIENGLESLRTLDTIAKQASRQT